jgi:hypothetical protein
MQGIAKQVGGRVAIVTGALTGLLFTALFLAGSASATTDPVETEIDALGSKVTLYGGAIVALVALSMAIWLGIKYMRKAQSKA